MKIEVNEEGLRLCREIIAESARDHPDELIKVVKTLWGEEGLKMLVSELGAGVISRIICEHQTNERRHR